MSKLASFAAVLLKGTKPADISRTREELGGLGDGVVKAFEVVLSPILFALIGLAIDLKVGSAPVFTLAFFFFGIAGMVIKLWYTMFKNDNFIAISHNGQSPTKVVRRSAIQPVGAGDLLGGDLEVPDSFDLTLDKSPSAQEYDD